jgi:uncharacterized repeat protein (TIGR01451 family)
MSHVSFFRNFAIAAALAAAVALVFTGLALAHAGPVTDPPGNVTLTLSGNCFPGRPIDQCQGRAGGLNMTYTSFDPSQYQDLYWGTTALGQVQLGLHGYGEAMTGMSYNLASGWVTWTGSTYIPVWNGSGWVQVTVPTRMRLTVTDLSNAPLALIRPSEIGLGGDGVLLHVTDDFKANIRFEAYYGGAWDEALELYDGLHTPAGNPPPNGGGAAVSIFNPGFYYTDMPLAGLSAANDSPTLCGDATALTATVLAGTNPIFAWSFGDGAAGSGITTSHTYLDPGLFRVVVTATNEAGWITATTWVSISETPVFGLTASNDSPNHLGEPTTLQASIIRGSYVSYTWAFGDGAYGAGQTLTHTYPSSGIYTAVVTAANSFNQITATTTVIIPFEIFNVQPVPQALAAAPGAPITITFTGAVLTSTVTSATFSVWGAQSGPAAGAISFPTVRQAVFTPAEAFKPGELISVRLLAGVWSLAGQALPGPYQWSFWAQAPNGSGYFAYQQSLNSPGSFNMAFGDLDGDGDLDAYSANTQWPDGQADYIWLNDGTGQLIDSGQRLGFANSLAVALGDLDGDGDLDAFIANGYNEPDEVWLNDGAGNFTNSGQGLGSTESYAVALGDLDSDGDLDAFVATYNSQPDRVYFNNGHGLFTDSGQALGSEYGQGLTLGDVDRDGDLDVYVANYLGRDKLWLNNGLGQFSDSGQTLDNLTTNDAEFGDVDGDGDLDVVLVNGAAGGQPNKLYLNTGGLLTDSGQTLGSYNSVSLELGDLDADGDLDIFFTTSGAGAHIWLNDGAGHFVDRGQTLGSGATHGLDLGDLDGDGDLDAFIAAESQPNTIWFNQVRVTGVQPSPASPSAAPSTNLAVTFSGPVITSTITLDTFTIYSSFHGRPQSGSFAAARQSLVFDPAADFSPGELVRATVTNQIQVDGGGGMHPYVWEFRAAVSGGSGNFANSGQVLPSPLGWTVELGDLDGDGDLDAFMTHYSSAPSQVWINNGLGFFTPGQVIPASEARDVALGDLDGDGDLDAFIGQTGGQPSRVWLNDGSAFFIDSGQAIGSFATPTVQLGDLDGDGDLDAFVATYDAQPDEVWFNDGSGLFTNSGQALGADYAVGMALGDVDNDGDLDAYVANCHTTRDQLWLNNGQGLFSNSGQTLDGMCTYEADFGDVDDDGDLDVVIANGAAEGQTNQLYLNNGQGVLTNSGQNLGTYQNTALKLGDLDADGDLDIFFSTFEQGHHIWLNDGHGLFTDTGQALGSAATRGLALGDLDGDGDLDAFAANDSASGVSGAPSEVWFNQNRAELSLSKSATPTLPQPGGWITYTLTFVNAGPQTAHNVQLVDQIPVSVTHASLAVSSNLPITLTGGLSFSWQLPNLPPGAGGVITITGQLSNTLPGSHTFTNTATLSAAELDTNLADNQAQASLTTNLAPLAAAGPDQDVETLIAVTLDGSLSSDPDANLPLAYRWRQTGGPPVSFSPAISRTTFTAPGDPAVLTFTLVVTDSLGQPSLADSVVITVHNQAPVAVTAPNLNVDTLALVTLDGSLSSDPDADLPLAYRWTQTGGPPVSFNPAISVTVFTAPGNAAVLTFTLMVTDSLGLPALTPAVTVVAVANQRPVAQAGPNQGVTTGQVVTLDGSLSYDPDDDRPLVYRWTQTGGPAVSFTPNISVTTFTAPGSFGVLTFTLQVTDSLGLPALQPDEVIITINNHPPVAANDAYTLTEDVPLSVAAPGLLANDSDPDSNTLTTTVVTAPAQGILALAVNGSFTYTPALNANGVVTFTYTVADGQGGFDQALVTLEILAVNDPPVVDAGPDQTASEGSPVSFAGSFNDLERLSAPRAGEAIHWDFGDGASASGVLTPTHTYADNGVYTVTLTVTDTLGAAGQDTLRVTVENAPPSLGPLSDQTLVEDTLLTVSVTYTDPGAADTHTAQIDWGDGTVTAGAVDPLTGVVSGSHIYATPGSYTLTITITDDDGGVDSLSVTVTVIPLYKIFIPFIVKLY